MKTPALTPSEIDSRANEILSMLRALADDVAPEGVTDFEIVAYSPRSDSLPFAVKAYATATNERIFEVKATLTAALTAAAEHIPTPEKAAAAKAAKVAKLREEAAALEATMGVQS